MTTLSDPVPGGRPGEVERADRLAKELGDAGVDGIALCFVDTAGVTRIKTVPVARLAHACQWGVGMSPVFDTFLADDSIVTTDVLGGPDGDLRLFPDLDPLVRMHAMPRWAWAPVDRMDQQGRVHPACTRSLLRSLLCQAAGEGIAFRVAIEVEFVLGRDDAPPGEFQPVCDASAYGMTRLVEQSEFCADVLRSVAAQGISVDQVHPEYAPGQYEISVAAADPVAAADHSVLVRQTLRALARHHGLRISFSPAVTAKGVGNGGHLHLSLWQRDRNAHSGGDGPLGMTAAAQSFTAGILAELPALAALLMPSPASYLRLKPGHWAGIYACWGHETREAAVRLVTGTTGTQATAANLEVKCADLAANPYLALAGVIAAGMAGVRGGTRIGEPITGDPSRFDDAELARRGIARLPLGLDTAITAFRHSQLLRGVLGGVLADAVVAVREGELRRCAELSPDRVAHTYRWVY
jgi:glutamine synthetase